MPRLAAVSDPPAARAKHLPIVCTLPSGATATAPTAHALSTGLEMAEVAALLRVELRARGLTDGDVGAALNVSTATAGAMLAGVKHINLVQVRRLARRLPDAAGACLAAFAAIVPAAER